MADALKELVVFIVILALVATAVAGAFWFVSILPAQKAAQIPQNSGQQIQDPQNSGLEQNGAHECNLLCQKQVLECEKLCKDYSQECRSVCFYDGRKCTESCFK